MFVPLTMHSKQDLDRESESKSKSIENANPKEGNANHECINDRRQLNRSDDEGNENPTTGAVLVPTILGYIGSQCYEIEISCPYASTKELRAI
jgi:hypothetical protein